MKRVLITGMSGTGKSSVIEWLRSRGYHAVDLDSDAWSEWAPVAGNPTGAKPGHDWLWHEDRVERLLGEERPDDLYVSGCASNMGRFLARFDHIVLLSAPLHTLLARLAVRTNNVYGKAPEEIAQVRHNLEVFEPLLRSSATHEIDAALPLDAVATAVLGLGGDATP